MNRAGSPSPRGELRLDVPPVAVEGNRGGQRQQFRGAEEDATLSLVDGVRPAAVVEAGGDPRPERHRPADAEHPPDQSVAPDLRGHPDGHEVQDLAHGVTGVEAGEEHVRVRNVELTGSRGGRGGQLEGASAVGVEDGAEYARRVERRTAVPVDGAVRADQRHGVHVADEAVLGDGEIPRRRAGLRSIPLGPVTGHECPPCRSGRRRPCHTRSRPPGCRPVAAAATDSVAADGDRARRAGGAALRALSQDPARSACPRLPGTAFGARPSTARHTCRRSHLR